MRFLHLVHLFRDYPGDTARRRKNPTSISRPPLAVAQLAGRDPFRPKHESSNVRTTIPLTPVNPFAYTRSIA
jgi:hypothetical protein